MPTIIAHAAVPLALSLGLGSSHVPTRLVAAGVLAAMLPDLDVLAFRFGIPYGDAFGHRGASHALLTAAVVGLVGAAAARHFSAPPLRVFLYLAVATASHGLLDTLTNGGHGVALLWPWSAERFFAPIQPIEVSPIGVTRFLSARGLTVLASEAVWIWLPCCVFALAWRTMTRRQATTV